jgi:hypothetical protein
VRCTEYIWEGHEGGSSKTGRIWERKRIFGYMNIKREREN